MVVLCCLVAMEAANPSPGLVVNGCESESLIAVDLLAPTKHHRRLWCSLSSAISHGSAGRCSTVDNRCSRCSHEALLESWSVRHKLVLVSYFRSSMLVPKIDNKPD